eukprot:m.357513 g.357513  ORF g.357513 m.357513 type:complete len:87 (+) comp17858_c0_seq1:27-287(+)
MGIIRLQHFQFDLLVLACLPHLACITLPVLASSLDHLKCTWCRRSSKAMSRLFAVSQGFNLLRPVESATWVTALNKQRMDLHWVQV